MPITAQTHYKTNLIFLLKINMNDNVTIVGGVLDESATNAYALRTVAMKLLIAETYVGVSVSATTKTWTRSNAEWTQTRTTNTKKFAAPSARARITRRLTFATCRATAAQLYCVGTSVLYRSIIARTTRVVQKDCAVRSRSK